MHPFSTKLVNWHIEHPRWLPWEKCRNAYQVWLLEVILQQTQISQGIIYYDKFLKYYPDIESLAEAHDDEVFKLWEGLGYYNRCRNMLWTARYIVNDLGGNFPTDFDSLLKLKGIGKYTAAIIASFVRGESVVAIDGNGKRLLCRAFGMEGDIQSASTMNKLFDLGNELIVGLNPADFNQALINFGATQCKPQNPNCKECFYLHDCYAYNNDKIHVLPNKKKKDVNPVVHMRYKIIRNENNLFWVKRRTGKGIWRNLYEFYLMDEPELETNKHESFRPEIYCEHKLTHRDLKITFQFVNQTESIVEESDGSWKSAAEIQLLAFPVPIKKHVIPYLN